MKVVPVILLNHLSLAQRRALVIADNQLAIAGAARDEELLRIELATLQEEDYDLKLAGFDLGWLSRGRDGRFAAQDLVLVFEAGDQPENTRIRLHVSRLASCFRYAAAMQLQPSNNAKSAPAEVIDATERAPEAHRIELTQIPSGPCYEVKLAENINSGEFGDQVPAEAGSVHPVVCGSFSQHRFAGLRQTIRTLFTIRQAVSLGRT